MATKKKQPVFTSPKGIGSYPYLLKYDDKFVAEGEYSVKLTLDADENVKFLDNLKAQAQEAYDNAIKDLKEKKKVKQAKELQMHVPFTEEYNDEGEETGNVVLNFKLKASVTTKDGKTFTQKPDVFDAKKKPIDPKARIGSGSSMKIAFNIIPFYNAATSSAGISLRLKAAQIIDLVEYGGHSADSYGFGEEDGYEGNDFDAEDSNDFSDESGEEDDGSGDF